MSHPWHDLSPGDDVPKEFNALIEIPLHSSDNYTMQPSIQPINPTRIAAAFDHKD